MDLPQSQRTPAERKAILLAGIANKMPGEKVDWLVHRCAIARNHTDVWVRQNMLVASDWTDDDAAIDKLAGWLCSNL